MRFGDRLLSVQGTNQVFDGVKFTGIYLLTDGDVAFYQII